MGTFTGSLLTDDKRDSKRSTIHESPDGKSTELQNHAHILIINLF